MKIAKLDIYSNFFLLQGLNKHKLLTDVLAVVGGHLRWQRLYMEYAEQLTTMKQT